MVSERLNVSVRQSIFYFQFIVNLFTKITLTRLLNLKNIFYFLQQSRMDGDDRFFSHLFFVTEPHYQVHFYVNSTLSYTHFPYVLDERFS